MSIYTDPPQEIEWIDGKPVVKGTGPPSDYQKWRDPYSLNPPGDSPEQNFFTPTTASLSPSFQAPQEQERTPIQEYSAPERSEQPREPLIAPYEYKEFEAPVYEEWKQEKPLETVQLSPYAERKREMDAAKEQGGMVFHPQHGWIPESGPNMPMVMPGQGYREGAFAAFLRRLGVR